MADHVGNVTVTGGSRAAISVTQQADYSRTPPVTTRTVSGSALTVTYSCPAQITVPAPGPGRSQHGEVAA